jgi:glutamine synthetase
MANLRFQALKEASNRTSIKFEETNKKSTIFGSNVFNDKAMKQFLTSDAYKAVKDAIQFGSKIDRKLADYIAMGMKEWALTKGVTHYTHWFQPLTGTTAEKHDAFFETSYDGSDPVEKFGGAQLVQQEPDASSFPNGGIRNTFEARGYTAWDPTSPAFIYGTTLCIPTVFISYTGEALDYKTPLLRALTVMDDAATEVCKYFDKNVKKVTATLGWEQEYFLIDRSLAKSRPDLMMTGRTLLGHTSAKGQQLDDHYFGSIPERVTAFMREFETEAILLGIPVTTRHNEVAPNQFECAPIFEECNLANDHNLLLMDILEKVARKHDFRVLLHEKPFAGVNGSGKHNNWSLGTDTGVNLLAPGKNPKTNLQFLTFFVNTIKAIHDNADLLRACIASASNDHRLGANEAPPAIISTFIGSQLSKTLDDLEVSVKAGKMTPEDKTELKLNIGKIPQIMLDNTDRNRTSPFAFTGNKFEFRAVGSSANCASAMIVLNTIMAKQLQLFKACVDGRIDKGETKDEAILKELQILIRDSKKIRFEGNGYGDEWVEEALKRGLNNLKDTPRALKAWSDKKFIQLFEEMNVLTARELEARQEIEFESYILKIQIEARLMGDLVQTHIIPAVIEYQNRLLANIQGTMIAMGEKAGKEIAATQLDLLTKISTHLNKMKTTCDVMLQARKIANKIEHAEEKAIAYCDDVRVYFDEIRYHADKLELLIDDELWPLPKFREMLFTR